MPYRTAIIGNLDLVEIDREGPIPAFVGKIDNRTLIVRFDVAALAKVAGKVGSGESVARALQARAPAIQAAAQTLLKGGFWTETEDGIEILVTALDL
ncbi:hypothetical protein [Sphingomonas montanisoli]|uniref:DUF1488 domain-containing protein n=1 Tax=Sphingomonas montanisoli TaxID=2606412 RepID=A0A5D9C288_9SPHN|nr:hypothetical protein [Sphingomonas montanisoli]TZG25736.1 hypothetical protein FYJ91_12075 [Sphingomonas montanisoli]